MRAWFLIIIVAMFSLSSLAGRIHELARAGQWDAVQQIIINGGDIHQMDQGQSLLDIATAQGRGEEFIRNNPQLGSVGGPYLSDVYAQVKAPPAYQEAVFASYPNQVRMDAQPSAPRLEVNFEAARIQIALADAAIKELQTYLDKSASLENSVEKVKFIRAYQQHVQELMEKLRFSLRRAFELSGRSSEVRDTVLFAERLLAKGDNSRLTNEVVTPGFCKRSKINKCLTNDCWAGEVVSCMHCGWGCRDCCNDGPCCCAYLSTAGVYGIVVGAVAGVVGLAQGVAITACSPFMCTWNPADTKQVGKIDVSTDMRLQSFLDEMKVFRGALGNSNNNNN